MKMYLSFEIQWEDGQRQQKLKTELFFSGVLFLCLFIRQF